MNNELTSRLFRLMKLEGDGAGGGASGGDGAGGEGGAGNEGSGGEGKGDEGKGESKGFDEFLKDPKNQSEFDKRIAKALETQKTKLEETYKQSISDAKKEAEKLAKMNAEQKAQYETDKIKAENEALKAQVNRIELGKEATVLLKEQKIEATQDILDFVVGDDAEKTKANIDKFVGIIQAQLKAAEVERSTGKTPGAYNNDDGEKKSKIQMRIDKYK